MQNCAYSNDPKNPTDMLGQPIAVGDFAAIATLSYKRTHMTAGRIDKITFKREVPCSSGYGREWINCPQHQAEKYTITLEVYQTTGWRYSHGKRTSTLQHVDHIVRLDVADIDKLVHA